MASFHTYVYPNTLRYNAASLGLRLLQRAVYPLQTTGHRTRDFSTGWTVFDTPQANLVRIAYAVCC